jgi:hypothetical protein
MCQMIQYIRYVKFELGGAWSDLEWDLHTETLV